mmetsp:Transcript_44256/g.127966  ORF Transcript_44256/g.127966 Transcript_44256/m.127966 type:complete len:248 (-) Transcript_44256:13-756(-)
MASASSWTGAGGSLAHWRSAKGIMASETNCTRRVRPTGVGGELYCTAASWTCGVVTGISESPASLLPPPPGLGAHRSPATCNDPSSPDGASSRAARAAAEVAPTLTTLVVGGALTRRQSMDRDTSCDPSLPASSPNCAHSMALPSDSTEEPHCAKPREARRQLSTLRCSASRSAGSEPWRLDWALGGAPEIRGEQSLRSSRRRAMSWPPVPGCPRMAIAAADCTEARKPSSASSSPTRSWPMRGGEA